VRERPECRCGGITASTWTGALRRRRSLSMTRSGRSRLRCWAEPRGGCGRCVARDGCVDEGPRRESRRVAATSPPLSCQGRSLGEGCGQPSSEMTERKSVVPSSPPADRPREHRESAGVAIADARRSLSAALLILPVPYCRAPRGVVARSIRVDPRGHLPAARWRRVRPTAPEYAPPGSRS
jgi:hypothetical protein